MQAQRLVHLGQELCVGLDIGRLQVLLAQLAYRLLHYRGT